MFSRRHPYLFFCLTMASIVAAAAVTLSIFLMIAVKGAGFGSLVHSGGEKVGVVEVTGAITASRDVIDELKRFREDDTIKAIVVRIDSPGGGVGPSQEIYREIRKTVEKKSVVASMGSVAASGGYYVAAGAEKIVANPGTITGSIGVILGFANYQELLQKIGLVPVVVKSGEYKDMGSPVRPMRAEERQIFEDFARKIHRQFIQDIVRGRQMDPKHIEALADGRIFTGEESKDLGLVDRLGNLEDAIEWAGRMGGIAGKIEAVYAREKKLTFLEYLLKTVRLKALMERLLQPELRAEVRFRPSDEPPLPQRSF